MVFVLRLIFFEILLSIHWARFFCLCNILIYCFYIFLSRLFAFLFIFYVFLIFLSLLFLSLSKCFYVLLTCCFVLGYLLQLSLICLFWSCPLVQFMYSCLTEEFKKGRKLEFSNFYWTPLPPHQKDGKFRYFSYLIFT